jgi:hypothetical protein
MNRKTLKKKTLENMDGIRWYAQEKGLGVKSGALDCQECLIIHLAAPSNAQWTSEREQRSD